MSTKKQIIGIIVLLILLAGMLILRGDEDNWICGERGWVKHGNPDAQMPTEQCGEIVCNNFDVQKCPGNCVVCPPCPECSSISCQTKEFCAEMGIDKDWYNNTQKPEEVFCTMDAKICPDGSGVGRVGPNCEFAPCPK